MGKLIKYGLIAVVCNWLVAIFLYLMGKITIALPMRIVIDESKLQWFPITWVYVTFWSVVASIGALLVYEIIFRKFKEDAVRIFAYVAVAALLLSFIPIYIAPFSFKGTTVVLVLIHIGSFLSTLGVMNAYQVSRT